MPVSVIGIVVGICRAISSSRCVDKATKQAWWGDTWNCPANAHVCACKLQITHEVASLCSVMRVAPSLLWALRARFEEGQHSLGRLHPLARKHALGKARFSPLCPVFTGYVMVALLSEKGAVRRVHSLCPNVRFKSRARWYCPAYICSSFKGRYADSLLAHMILPRSFSSKHVRSVGMCAND